LIELILSKKKRLISGLEPQFERQNRRAHEAEFKPQSSKQNNSPLAGRQGALPSAQSEMIVTPAEEGHGLCPWMNALAFGRDVAPLGREVGCHGLCPWGSTFPGSTILLGAFIFQSRFMIVED